MLYKLTVLSFACKFRYLYLKEVISGMTIIALIAFLAMCIALIYAYKKQSIPETKSFIAVIPWILLVCSVIGGLSYGLDAFLSYYILFIGMALISIGYICVIRHIDAVDKKENTSVKQKVSDTGTSSKT